MTAYLGNRQRWVTPLPTSGASLVIICTHNHLLHF